ncbi:MAG TPA: hypothetical protein VGH84_01160 [Steroidobacteraceae bacterium]|jgi:hypothetical protein
MPITSEQMKAAIGARRLQDDEVLQGVLDRIVEDATGQAIYLDDVDNREAARQLVLAVTRLRVHLQADADLPEEIKAHDELARSME